MLKCCPLFFLSESRFLLVDKLPEEVTPFLPPFLPPTTFLTQVMSWLSWSQLSRDLTRPSLKWSWGITVSPQEVWFLSLDPSHLCSQCSLTTGGRSCVPATIQVTLNKKSDLPCSGGLWERSLLDCEGWERVSSHSLPSLVPNLPFLWANHNPQFGKFFSTVLCPHYHRGLCEGILAGIPLEVSGTSCAGLGEHWLSFPSHLRDAAVSLAGSMGVWHLLQGFWWMGHNLCGYSGEPSHLLCSVGRLSPRLT